MSEKMYPIPFDSLMNWVTSEYAQCGDVFGVHKHYHASGKSLPIFGERIETPFGPAAGPNSQLAQQSQISVKTQYANSPEQVNAYIPYLTQDHNRSQLLLLPITSDNQLDQQEQKNSLVVRGQYAGPAFNPEQKIVLHLDGHNFDAKLDDNGIFSAAIDAHLLVNSPSKTVVAELIENKQVKLQTTHSYKVNNLKTAKQLDIDIQPLSVVDPQKDTTVVSGKVIKPYSSLWLYFAIIVDNLASGLAGAAFIAFLSSLTSVSFTAVQYAIFSSLMTLTPKILGGYSGTIVSNIGYPKFFLMTTLIGIPILVLVVWVAKLLREHQSLESEHKGD